MAYENCPRKDEVHSYLKEHKIYEMLQNLNGMLFYHRPENPKQFLVEQLILLKNARDENGEAPFLFNENNALSIFHMLDPCEKGAISAERYIHALETMGIKIFEHQPKLDKNELIGKEMFVEKVRSGLKQLASTYSK